MDPSKHLRLSNPCGFSLDSTAPQPSELWTSGIGDFPKPPAIHKFPCALLDDGQVVAWGDPAAHAEYNRRKAAYLKLKADFLSLTGNSINKAIECYQGMCKKIGETYAPPTTPSNVTPLPSEKGAIAMPGARLVVR
jgi:hypothetical protein